MTQRKNYYIKRNKKILRLYKRGYRFNEIAKKLFIECYTVRHAMKNFNIHNDNKPYGYRLWHKIVDEPLMIEMHKDGYSLRQIGRKFNLSKQGVKDILNKLNIDTSSCKLLPIKDALEKLLSFPGDELTVSEFANLLNRSVEWVRLLILSGKIKAFKVPGEKTKIKKSEIDAFIASLDNKNAYRIKDCESPSLPQEPS